MTDQPSTTNEPKQQGQNENPQLVALEDGEKVGKEVKVKEQTTDEAVYPTDVRLFIIILCIMTASFLVNLDGNIVGVAIPRITDQFHSVNSIGWYGSAFLLTRCCITLTAGKFYTLFSIKALFLISIGIFEIGSIICGAAPNSVALILGRAIAGLGTAGMMSGVQIIMVHSVPLVKRPKYQGLFGALMGVASVVGPLLGGALSDGPGWRWCFYINAPLGGTTILALLFVLQPPKPPGSEGLTLREKLAKLDPIGNLLVLPATVCLLLALEWGGSTYAWANARIIILIILAGILSIVFISTQIWKGDAGTVPLRIIKQRTVAAACFYNLCTGASMMVTTYYIPLWFQGIKGVSAVQSGIRLLPLLLGVMVGAMIGAVLTSKTGYYTPQTLIAPALSAVGVGLITTWDVRTGTGKLMGYQILYGVGLGVGMMQPNMAMQTVLSKKDIPIGTSLLFFVLPLGGAIFLSVAQSIFNNKLADNLHSNLGLDVGLIVGAGGTELRQLVPADELSEVLNEYSDALLTGLYVAVAMSAASIFGALAMEWRTIKKGEGQAEKEALEAGSEAGVEKEADV